MAGVRRPARASSPRGGRLRPDVVESAVVRGAPGLAALLESLSTDGRHSILDLGTASGGNLEFLGRFAHRIRFAALVPREASGSDGSVSMDALVPNPGQPYDVVLAWDALDQLDPSERPALIDRLAEITAPRARLYALVSASTESIVQPVRSTILAHDRVSMEPLGPTRSTQLLLPAAVERLLTPFEITNAFTLRVGLREYVAMKRET